jgi:hypothetical protein
MPPLNAQAAPTCARCGRAIDPADHFVVRSADRSRSAALCRTEHIVAWVLRGAPWQVERPWELDQVDRAADGPLVLERVRAGESIEREFDDAEALRAWAAAGGFWAQG